MIVAEPIVAGDEHVAVNAGLLWAAVAATGAPVTCWAESRHFDLITPLLPPDVLAQVRFEAHTPPPRHRRHAARFRGDALAAWRMVHRAAALGERHLLLTCALPGTLVGTKVALASLPARRRPRVDAVVHSALEQAWGWRSRNPLRRALDLTSALNLGAPDEFRLVVLESVIAHDLAAQLPRVAGHLRVVDFPIVETVASPTRRRPGPPRVGFLGRANREKGFDRFCQLAAEVAARGGQVEFHAVGHAPPGAFDDSALRSLATPPAPAPIDRQVFLERVADLDLVVLLHDAAHYAHTASGVLLDAMAAGRPVLSLPNTMIEALAEEHGEIGPGRSDLEGIADYLAGLSEADLDGAQFADWRANVRRVAQSRHPTAVAHALG